MKLSDFNYNLDESRIAKSPASPRDSSKLMIINKWTWKIEEKNFRDIIDYLWENDVLVFNETKVIKARLKGFVILQDWRKKEVEVFLLNQKWNSTWECQVFPGERLKIWKEVFFEINKIESIFNHPINKMTFSNFYPPDKGGSSFFCPPDKGEARNEQGVKYIPYNPELTKLAQQNRKNPTPFENKMYYEVLKVWEFLKYKFIRQKPIDNFIVDFYCSELWLVIEIDWDSHIEQIEYDEYRTNKLNELWLKIIRYTNSEILWNIEWVYKDLLNKINPPTPLIREAWEEEFIRASWEEKLINGTWEADFTYTKLEKNNFEKNKENSLMQSDKIILSWIIKEITYSGRIIEFSHWWAEFFEIIDKIWEIPLPPYIEKQNQTIEQYNTVIAKIEWSAAAPTAWLHFTDELLKKIEAKWVKIEKVLLHIGLGTFKPITAENILEHEIHSEYIEISQETANNLNEYKQQWKNIIAIWTTTTRTLESFAQKDWKLDYWEKNTNIFIYPWYKFKFIDSIITNFHLPKSSLLVMISAFYNREKLLEIYDYAQENNYRFFSFGDAMWIK